MRPAAKIERDLAYGMRGGNLMTDDRIEALEARLAHLDRANADLSDVVARQAREIDRLTRRLAAIEARDAEREAEGGGAVTFGDRPPPHW